MWEIMLPLAMLATWIVLMRWVLPWFGICTCMSGGCTGSECPPCGLGGETPRNDEALESKGIQP